MPRHSGSSWCVLVALTLLSTTADGQEPGREDTEARRPDRVETYKTIGDVKLAMDIYLPADHQPTDRRPAIVFFFGGGWRGGSPRQFAHHGVYLASRGLVALSAEYRVSSRHNAKVVDCVADAKSAMRWVRSNAARLGIDPEKIVASGGSAGGHLAAATATIDAFDDPADDKAVSPHPQVLALFNPVLDLTRRSLLPDSPQYDEVLSRLGAKPEELSPTLHLRASMPPTIIFHGEADTTVPITQIRAFTEKMRAAGTRCELAAYPGKNHAFFNFARDEHKNFVDTVRRLDEFLAELKYVSGPPQVQQYMDGLKPQKSPQ